MSDIWTNIFAITVTDTIRWDGLAIREYVERLISRDYPLSLVEVKFHGKLRTSIIYKVTITTNEQIPDKYFGPGWSPASYLHEEENDFINIGVENK